MIEEQEFLKIQKSELLDSVRKMFEGGYRLVQISCTKCADCLEVNYSFDKDRRFTNLRITTALNGESIPSVSGIYLNAFLYENEIHDLFGLKIEGIAIDYKGNFYRTATKKAFNE